MAALSLTVRAESTNVNANVNGITNNTNVQQAIVSILMGSKNVGGDIYDASKSVLAGGIDLVKNQAPELVTEFLKWKFTEALIWTIGGLILFIFGAIVSFISIKKLFFCPTKSNEEYIPVLIFLGLLPVLIGCIGFFYHIFTIIQIWIAPKIYLIEYIADIIKNHH